jgi:putative DNA primase/helicase
VTAHLSAAELARALGGKRAGRDWMTKCPAHDERTASLSIREGNAGPLVHCFAGCSQRDVIDALIRRGLWPSPSRSPGQTRGPSRPLPPRRSMRRDDRWRLESVARIWREAHDPHATVAERYLNNRELEIDDDLAGRVLRFHPACPWGEGAKAPCLIAAFRPIVGDVEESAPPVAILRVGLTSDGEKISRKMLGQVAGCAIKLDVDADVTHGLGIAEGLETAMSLRAIGWRPVWALGSAGAIAEFPVLNGIETLTIFADNDAPAPSEWSPTMEQPVGAGEKAARACQRRWADAGRQVRLFMPRAPGVDWADEWGVR